MKHDDNELVITVLVLIASIFLWPLVAMWLWNWLAVSIFNAPILTYWQVFGLRVLLGFIIPHSSSSSK